MTLNHITLQSLTLLIFEVFFLICQCELFLEANFLGFLVLCEVILEDLIDPSNILGLGFFVTHFDQDFVTHKRGLTFYMKEGLPFALGFLRILIYVFDWFYVIR